MKLSSPRIHVEHPGERARDKGAVSQAWLSVVNEGRKTQPVERIDLTEDDLVDLIAQAAKTLQILRAVGRR